MDTKVSYSKKFLITLTIGLIFAYLWLSSLVVGRHDILFLLFWGVNFAIIWHKVFDLKSRMRSMVKVIFTDESLCYRFFDKKSPLQIVITIIMSLIIALSFIITLKALMLRHGTLVTLIVLLIPSFILQMFKGPITLSIDQQIKDDDGRGVIAEIVDISVKAIILTIILSIIFSMLETVQFYTNTVDFYDFSKVAENMAIEKVESGKYSRLPVNFMAIQQAFSSASVNEILGAADINKNIMSPFWFWLVDFVINTFRLLPFSVAYLFLIITMQRKGVDWALKLGVIIKNNKLTNLLIAKVKTVYVKKSGEE